LVIQDAKTELKAETAGVVSLLVFYPIDFPCSTSGRRLGRL
jgi:hypothetical protein